MSTPVPLASPESPPALRLVTLGVPLLLAGAAFLPDEGRSPPHPELLAVALLTGLGFWLAPRRLRYELTGDGVVIQTLLSRTVLPYAGLRARRSAGRLGLRTFGTGLPGYLTGNFTFGPDPAARNVRAAATRTGGGVLLESGGQVYFLTPADPGGFLAALARRGSRVEE
ncbi:hypothetical protein L1280_002736 [Deinococcus sp. HSC-46F16]|uniref:PH domain-containing protein n=1 Tax=Deinococcus sp. HSC-46F16 TaxID=2910968 RepID=UPI0020A0DA53|nr:PH domain-containing protein [Deinococcus sp. HSC-46F16]MCP2015568.1 hypothetical protein [Deinococcus sp. HSC-46F16]